METLRETDRFAASLGSLYGYHHLAPFPGTTVREEAERYDLEILTDDWTRYDANSAIVRTASLSPAQIERFVKAFEAEIQGVWESMVRDYREGTLAPEMVLQVEGHFRMKLVYRLLAEDLIEEVGTVRRPGVGQGKTALLEELCVRIEGATGIDGGLIRRTLRSFVASGYLKAERAGETARWFWTHNNRVDRCGACHSG